VISDRHMNAESTRSEPTGSALGVLVEKIRLVLADDNHTVLTGLHQELGKEFDIVETVNDGQKAIEAVRRLDPDVLVLDISMPILDGIQVATQLRDASCRTKIVFLTIHEQPEYALAAFSAGAQGYVTKRHLADLIPAIHQVLSGRNFVSPSLQ
jgi:DNA-binding NarL/FixJ family response regulator